MVTYIAKNVMNSLHADGFGKEQTMSRYIDADALIADLDKGLWGKDYDKVLAEAIIRDAPTIDIVRCKECKNWKWIEWAKEYRCILRNTAFNARANDFCSYGEREGE